jgi:exodeoxyribonuclease VII small subunit
MSDERDEDREVRLIEVEETVVVAGPSPDDGGSESAAPADDIQGMSYEAARDALVGVVDRLERGGSTLEESLALWERGEALAARCETWLIGARARLDAARGTAPADA